MTNFDEFKKPLPKDPKEISDGIDGLLRPAEFFEPRDEEDRDEIDKKIREIGSKKKEPFKLPTLEEAVGMTPEQEEAFHELRREQGKEEAPNIFPEPFGDLEGDSPAQKKFNRIMRENREQNTATSKKEETGEPIEDKRYSQTIDPKKDVQDLVDPDFLGGRMISSGIIIFWPTMSEENFQSLGSNALSAFVHPMSHYRQNFEEKRDEFLNINDKKEVLLYYGADNYQKMVDFQNGYVKRIMELSDPNQIRKYDKLVDEFNADRERIIKERDYEGLQKYIAKVKALIRETK